MRLERLIEAFLPKTDKFFVLFEQLAGVIVKAADTLKKISNANGEGIVKIVKEVEEFEHQCDTITHDIFSVLNTTFVTPFDREDIHQLASSLDDIMDYTDEAVARLALYKVDSIPEPMLHLITILHSSAVEIHHGVGLLRDMGKAAELHKILEKIHSYENQADDVFERAIAELFENQKDPIQLVKLKDIYESFELATDKCESVANVMESILIKHA